MPKGRPRAQKNIERELRSVASVEDKKSIIEDLEEKVQAEAEMKKGRIPGVTHGSTKVTYTYQDLLKMFPVVAFTPGETLKLTFQGVSVQARGGIEMHVPECFKKIYDQHQRELSSDSRELRGLGIIVEKGAGTLN